MKRLISAVVLAVIGLVALTVATRRVGPLKEAPKEVMLNNASSKLSSPALVTAVPTSIDNSAPRVTATVAFNTWTNTFLGATISQRAVMVNEGITLATARQGEFVQLIKSDPRQALEQTPPVVTRNQLPKEVVALLETRVAGTGDSDVLCVMPPEGEGEAKIIHVVRLNGSQYSANVYGRREHQLTKTGASLSGIALNGEMALRESPIRVLEEGESTSAALDNPITGTTVSEAEVFVESHGKIWAAKSADLPVLASQAAAAEASPGPDVPVVLGIHQTAMAPATTWTTGVKNVLVIRVDFSDKPGDPKVTGAVTRVANQDTLTAAYGNTQASGTNDFFVSNSLNATSMVFTVSPRLYRMPSASTSYTSTGDYARLHADATTLANADHPVGTYGRVVVAFTRIDFGWAGLAYLGGRYAWTNGEFSATLLEHELGHTYGLYHANTWRVVGGNPISSAGSSVEYNDPYDEMGGSGHFSVYNKNLLGWVPDSAVNTVSTTGRYRVYASDASNAPLGQTLALKINRSTSPGETYWVSLRVNHEYDYVNNKAYVQWCNTGPGPTNLINCNPTQNSVYSAMNVGGSLVDSTRNVTISAVATGGSAPNQYIDMDVTFSSTGSAPSFTTHPSSAAVIAGNSLTLTAFASGIPTPTLQWKKDGVNIAGATNGTYVFSSLVLGDAGSYSCTATNSQGTITSNPAVLTVTSLPAITVQPPADKQVIIGQAWSVTIVANGNPTPTYQWAKDNVNIPGATSSTYSVNSATATDAGFYNCFVTNSVGTRNSNRMIVTAVAYTVAPVFTVQPQSTQLNQGQQLTLTASATGTPSPTYTWYRNNVQLIGATGTSFTIGSVATTDAGVYTCKASNIAGAVYTNGVIVTVNVVVVNVLPSFTTQPVSATVVAGNQLNLSVAASGVPTPSFQWQFNGVNIAGATNSTYIIGSTSSANAGTYACVASNSVGSVSSNSVVVTIATAPSFTLQPPASLQVTIGQLFSLSVAASGTPAPVYQWRKDGTNITGANSSTYSTTATATNGGSYACVAANSGGSVVSSATVLSTVVENVAPVFITNPASAQVNQGGNLTLTVVASGTPAPTYQWRKDGQNIPSATSAQFTVLGVALTDSGNYTCVATNSVGTATSGNATVAVNYLPVFTTNPNSATIIGGNQLYLSVVATGLPSPTLQWQKNGINIAGAINAQYIVNSTSATDAGVYTCIATNSIGSTTSNPATIIISTAPVFTVQPPDSLRVTIGQQINFSVTATGTPAPTYQWRKDGSNINGATSFSLRIASATVSDAGVYNCLASNSAGSTTSSSSNVTTVSGDIAPTFTVNPVSVDVNQGNQLWLSVTASGTPVPTYQWQRNSTSIQGATNSSYIVASVSVSQAGTYTCVATNTAGTATSSTATVGVNVGPTFTVQPQSTVNNAGNPLLLSATAVGTPTPTYQWQKNGQNIAGANASQFSLQQCSETDAGTYTCVAANSVYSATSNQAVVTVNYAPRFTLSPVSTQVTIGQRFYFTALASGMPTPTYQWRKDGVNISGANSSTYSVSVAAAVDAGTYTCAASNSVGTTISGQATLVAIVDNVAPSFSTNPFSAQINLGGQLSLTAMANGTPAPTYQWQKNGQNISGANGTQYTIAAVSKEDAGAYTCVASNSMGSATSLAATITVNYSPVFTTHPISGTILSGNQLYLTAVVTGNPHPNYQWQKNGANILGAVETNYVINNTSVTDTGTYTCVATNSVGATVSNQAVVIVSYLPTFTVQPIASLRVTLGQQFSLTATASGSPAPTYQWRKDSQSIAGATNTTFTVVSAVEGDAGTYSCVASNSAGSAVSTSTSVTTVTGDIAPSFTINPISTELSQGSTLNLQVSASGTPAPTYQWQRNGVSITGATNTLLSLASITTLQAGQYTCIATNAAGSVTSNTATVSVNVGPTITSHPQSINVNAGNQLYLTVAATATPAPAYQWQKNGVAVLGANAAQYVVGTSTESDAGNYTCIVSNPVSSVVSNQAVVTINYLPRFTVQPTSGLQVTIGQPFTLAVSATGNPAPSYQWLKDGTGIAGASSSSYTVLSTVALDAGTYSCLAINSVGSCTSSTVAVTTVSGDIAPTFSLNPQSVQVTVGSSVTLTVQANGTPAPTYQWFKDGSSINGANVATYTVTTTTVNDGGVYTCQITNTAGSATSSPASVVINVGPVFTIQPASTIVTVGESLHLTAEASGTPSPTYQWKKNGQAISLASAASYTVATTTVDTAGNYTCTATNSVGVTTSTVATVAVNHSPYFVVQPPASLQVTSGQQFTFIVSAAGLPIPVYQWFKDGARIAGAESSTLTVTSVTLGDAGSYTCLATNTVGSVYSSPVIVSTVSGDTAPTFTVNLQNIVANQGDTLSLSVSASGNPSPSFQWLKNGQNITGATTSTYTVPNCTIGDAGIYSCIASNRVGNVSSSQGTVTINSGPVFTTQPISVTVNAGNQFSLTATATGNPSPTYQWMRNGQNITNATSSTFSESSATAANSGNYSCLATNPVASVTSSVATVTVNSNTAPTFISQPADSIEVNLNGTITLAVVATGTPDPILRWLKNGQPITNAGGAQLTISNVTMADAGNYSCMATNSVGSITSSATTVTVNFVPTFTTQPPASLRVTLGQSFTFTTNASSNPAATYQWVKNSSHIAGANSATLTISNATISDAGSYYCIATNIVGSAVSNTVTVTTVSGDIAPSITAQPQGAQLNPGVRYTISISASGTPTPTYQWRKDNQDLAGATNNQFIIASATATDAGNYTCVVTNSAGSATSNAAIVGLNSVPVFTVHPQAATLRSGVQLTLTVSASGIPEATYQWRKDNVAIAGATGSQYTKSGVSSADAGTYSCLASNSVGAAVSNPANVIVTFAPEFVAQPPASLQVTLGQPFTFTVSAVGNPVPTYQWTRNNAQIAGAVGATLSVSSATVNDAGTYTCVATNSAGSTASTAVSVTTISGNVGPVFTVHPLTVTINQGNQLTLTALASGTPAPTYQWQKNGQNIAGALSSTFTAQVTVDDAGSYACLASNAVGTVSSNLAIVSVNVAPYFTTTPRSTLIIAGNRLTLTAYAMGTPAPTYQWRKGTQNINGATSSMLVIEHVVATDAGAYVCVATNSVDSTFSGAAEVTVNSDVVPSFTLQPPTNIAVTSGNTLSINISATGTPVPSYQWQRNGQNILGATTQQLTITSVSVSDSGTYTCSAVNSVGTVSSNICNVTVQEAPLFTTHPQSVVYNVGSQLALSASATGIPTPTYQWQKGGNNIAGATGASFIVTSTTVSDAGMYTCVATNAVGSISSRTAEASINTSTGPVFTIQPVGTLVITIGNLVTITVEATGTPTPTYQWRKDGQNIAGATGPQYIISAVGTQDAGVYTCTASNSVSSVISNSSVLSITVPPSFTTHPSSRIITLGGQLSLTAVATGTPSPTYQWQRNGASIAGATGSVFVINIVGESDAGAYVCVATNTAGSVSSNNATITIDGNVAPQFVSQPPARQTVALNNTLSVAVQASGTPTPTYQWFKNGQMLQGLASRTLEISSVTGSDTGNYTCVATNLLGSATSNVMELAVNSNAEPVFTRQPVASLNVSVNNPVSIIVTVTGTPTPTLQWQKDGVNITGATNAQYTIPVAAQSDAGRYTCVATNTVGNATSGTCVVTVSTVNRVIIAQDLPASTTITTGNTATLWVAVSGQVSSYRWSVRNIGESAWTLLEDSADYSGSKTSALNIRGNSFLNGNNYKVTVFYESISSDGVNSTLSLDSGTCLLKVEAPVIVNTVVPPVVITPVVTPPVVTPPVVTATFARNLPTNISILPGSSGNLSVTVSGVTVTSYKWKVKFLNEANWNDINNSATYSGSNTDTLTINGNTSITGSQYTVTIQYAQGTGIGSLVSTICTLNIGAATRAAVVTQPSNSTARKGQSTTLSATVTGDNLTYAWQFRAGVNGEWITLTNNSNYTGVNTAQLSIKSTAEMNGYQYRAVVTGGDGATVTTNPASLAVNWSEIANLSLRTNLGVDQTLMVGFVTSGQKKLLTRAVGPTLMTLFGLRGNGNPVLSIMGQDGTVLARNSIWDNSLSSEFSRLGAFPLNAGSGDAALLTTITGAAVAQVDGYSGVTLVELYDAENDSRGQLMNVSARNQIGTGGDIMIAGFVITGNVPKTLLLRGVGQTLGMSFNITGALQDTILSLYNSTGNKIAENDNWTADLTPVFDKVGAFRLLPNSLDSALMITLQPGVYTAQVAGANNATGNGMIEIYVVEP